MRFEIHQRFRAPRDEVLRAYTDPSLYGRMEGLERIGPPDVLETTVDGDRALVRLRYRFIADLPSAALRVIDPSKLSWVEETRYDLVAGTGATTLLPDHYADRFSGSASSRFETDPDDETRTVRRITGEVKIRMPLVGGRVEGAIVEGLQEHLADEARVVDTYLAG